MDALLPGDVDDFLRGHSVIPDDGMFPAGAAFGDWRITAFVAKGGNGEVYRVENRISGESAALKVLAATSDATKRERFLREATLLGRLKGPCFPRLFATGEVEGHPYFVIEFLEPVELPKDDRAIARYLLEVCEAVGAVHRLGYVHRDLKPQNILRREDGTLVLIDYGLAKPIVSESIPKADSLSIVDGRPVGVGTPKYAAPEQLAGGAITPATDIHALGMLANECFSGNPPRIWHRVIARATSSIPARRFEDVDDFSAAIRSRNRGVWMLRIGLLAAILALLAIVGWIWWANGGDEQYRWSRLCDAVVTNEMREVVLWEELRTNVVGGVQHILPGARATKKVPVRVECTKVKLGKQKHEFLRPIKLEKGEYRIEGPGWLNADISGPTGTVVRLCHCIVTNRSAVAYPQNGIRYILEGMAELSFPNLSRKNMRRYIEPFDGKINRVMFGKGKQFEISEEAMLELDL